MLCGDTEQAEGFELTIALEGLWMFFSIVPPKRIALTVQGYSDTITFVEKG